MRYTTLLTVLLLLPLAVFGQDKATFSGTVKDASKGEELIGVSVRLKDQNIGAKTNEYGFFSVTLPKGSYDFVVYYDEFVTQEFKVDLSENRTMDIQLAPVPKAETIQEVVITAERQDANVKSANMGVEKLDPKELNKLPVLFGERDIIKSMQLLPGVKNAGEGSSGFYVRGGGADQNLILLDEAPVYNASHLLGFFSTFNSDAIKDATLYKGNQPANFGGRLSSVLDIKMNEGNSKRYNVGGGLGLISSKLNVEGPIVKDKASFLVTGRRTYADVFLKASEKFKDNSLYFYDLNAKVNYRVSKKDRIFLSGYFGRDKLGLKDVFGIDWGNTTGTVRWNHIASEKLFSNTSLIYSKYDYKINFGGGDMKFKLSSQIRDFNLKQEFQYYPNTRNKIRFGANVINHAITPGQVEITSSTDVIVQKVAATRSFESAIYVTNDWAATENINFTYGFRVSAFSVLGNGAASYTYDANGDVVATDTTKKGDLLKTYYVPEPRASVSWSYSKDASFKAAYSRNSQNIHQVSNSTSGSPTDVWMSSSLNIKPEIADQFALGWFKNFKDNEYEFNVETYYKTMQNQIDFKNGANEQANEKLEGELLAGIGRAYGLEMIIKRKRGRLTGWIGYTLSRTERKINGINDNNWYLARQDRLHDISVVTIYDITPKLSVSALFIYYTGNAVTFPSGKYEVNGETYFLYTERNGYRMPAYHRMDVGLTWKRKDTEKYESSWNFSIYNVYARENAYAISFRENADNPNKTEAVQTTLFKIIPAITYNFKFK